MEPIRLYQQITFRVGGWIISKIMYFVDFFAFCAMVLRSAAANAGRVPGLVRKTAMRQLYITGVQSFILIAGVALVMGGMVIIQGNIYLSRIGFQYMLGDMLISIIIQHLGPLFTVMIIVIKSGMAMTTEVGFMSANGELDDIKIHGMDSGYLVAWPRLVGYTIGNLCLIAFFDIFAVLGGMLLMWILANISVGLFFEIISESMGSLNLLMGLFKGFLFSVIASFICLYRGFFTRSVMDIPRLTAGMIIECLVFLFVTESIISLLYYL